MRFFCRDESAKVLYIYEHCNDLLKSCQGFENCTCAFNYSNEHPVENEDGYCIVFSGYIGIIFHNRVSLAECSCISKEIVLYSLLFYKYRI